VVTPSFLAVAAFSALRALGRKAFKGARRTGAALARAPARCCGAPGGGAEGGGGDVIWLGGGPA
jgi:hypothetical protein